MRDDKKIKLIIGAVLIVVFMAFFLRAVVMVIERLIGWK